MKITKKDLELIIIATTSLLSKRYEDLSDKNILFQLLAKKKALKYKQDLKKQIAELKQLKEKCVKELEFVEAKKPRRKR
jgi:archaellum component FlaC